MEEFSFLPLLIISGLAFGVPFIASRIPGGIIPIVVIEIIAGIAFGKAGLGLIESDAVRLNFLAQFGFAFLMFLSGLEVDFGMLSRLRAERGGSRLNLVDNPLFTGFAIFVLTLIGAGFGAWVILGNAPISHILLMGLVLSTTSVGIVVPTLKERGMTRQPLGQTILMAAMVADFITIFLITILAAFLDAENVLQVLLVAILILVFGIAVYAAARLRFHDFVLRTLEELAHATAQIRVRGALALMLVFVVLAEAVEAELVLGAFLAGAVISFISREEGSALRVKLEAIGFGFFVPVFFITVGADFDLDALRESPSTFLLVPALVAVAYAVKVLPALILTSRYTVKESLSAGFLLSSRLSLIIAASVIGLRLGVIDEATNAAIILVAVITSTVSPAVFNRLYPKKDEEHQRVVIMGGGGVGRMLARRLELQNMRPFIIESDQERAIETRKAGFDVIVGDGLSSDVMARAEMQSAAAFVAATAKDDVNLQACIIARDEFGVEHLVAQVNSVDRIGDFQTAGVHAVSQPLALAIALDSLVLRPDIFGVLEDPASESDILEIPLRNHQFVGKPVDKVRLPGDAIIVLVLRDGHSFVPHPNSVLEFGDLLTIAGERAAVEEAIRLVGSDDGVVMSV